MSDITRQTKIECRRVRHWFNDPRSKSLVEAITHVDLDVYTHEVLAIVGPSGCGKTTLLNMMAGTVTPTEGVVAIDGKPVRGVHASDMGYMFARDTLLPWRTVQKNIELGLEFDRVPKADRRTRTKSLVDLVGLDGFERHYPDALSHGMRQRVALARTLVRDPEILLMDEPFGALDAQTRTLMQEEFVRMWETREPRSTVVFVTHDLAEAIVIGDRVAVFGARPGYIKSVYEINLPRKNRNDMLHQADPRFRELYGRIWSDIKDEAVLAAQAEREAMVAMGQGRHG